MPCAGREITRSIGTRFRPLSANETGKTGWTFHPHTKTLRVPFLVSDFKLQVTIGS
jgi:hypothetical protein